MIRKFHLTFLVFFILSMDGYSGTTRLSGVVENANGYTIRLKAFTDAISLQDTIIAQATLDEQGIFDFQIEVEYPRTVVLKLGFQTNSFYIEPDKEYNLKVYYDPEKEQVSYLAKHRLLFDFVDLPKDDLNSLIEKFNMLLDEFLIKNFYKVYKYGQVHLLDSLRYDMFGVNREKSRYFGDLMEFRLADIQLAAKGNDDEMIFFEFLGNKPIRYNHHEYMVFFNTFFNEYIKTKTNVLRFGELRSLINEQENPDALSKALKKDLILMDDRIRELVILRDLYFFFYDFDFRTTKVIQHITYLSENSAYPEHRNIARNLIKRITSLQPRSPIPDFTFTDLEGNQKSKKDYLGKYLLLNFWELDCNDCFKNIDSLEYLQKAYADKLNVISVSGYKYVSDLKRIIGDKEFSMEFLLASPDNLVYDKLKIRSLPAAVLIDDKGKIVLYPAILPGRGFRNTFKSVFK